MGAPKTAFFIFSDVTKIQDVQGSICLFRDLVPKMIHNIKVAAATFRRPLAWNFGFRIVVSLFQERDFKISGSGAFGFQYFRLRSFPISRFPASERQDFNISRPGASKSRIFNGNRGSLIPAGGGGGWEG